MRDGHNWLIIGENTSGFVQWCKNCGALRDEDTGKIFHPHYPWKKELCCEDEQDERGHPDDY